MGTQSEFVGRTMIFGFRIMERNLVRWVNHIPEHHTENSKCASQELRKLDL